jgi:hypothetical protein
LTFDWSNIDFLSFRKSKCFLSYQWTSYLIEKAFTHTHALHELSLLFKKFFLQKLFAHRLFNSFLYACIFFTSSLTIFTGLDPCVCWFLVDNLTLLLSPIFVLGYGFNFILCLPFVIVWQKGGVFFYCIWSLDRKCISKPVKCFCSRMAKGRVC